MPQLYSHNGFDMLTYPGYMLAAFKSVPRLAIPNFPFRCGESEIPSPATPIVGLGEKRPGRSSAGWKVFDLPDDSFWTFAGSFTENDDRLLFFNAWEHGEMKFVPPAPGEKLPGTEYAAIYVAFYDFSASELLFQTSNQTARMVNKVFKFKED